MCLGVPGEIQEIDGHEAVADFWGVERRVRIDIVGAEVDVGDYILNHAGFAIRKIPEREVEETMEIYESLFGDDPDGALEEMGAPSDAAANLELGEGATAGERDDG